MIKGRFKFLEDIATADVAFEAYGKDLNQLFENVALALFETMVDTKQIQPILNFQFTISNSNLENLLFDFLDELIFLKDSKGVVLSDFKVKITGGYKLEAQMTGEEIDPKKHRLKADVKAVTMHKFEVAKTKEGHKARVVLDI